MSSICYLFIENDFILLAYQQSCLSEMHAKEMEELGLGLIEMGSDIFYQQEILQLKSGWKKV